MKENKENLPAGRQENKDLKERPPVVVVLGHVDHGKSSILEAIKDLKITAKESGGITQHIGAYQIEHSPAESGEVKKITFIDTPGHEAFNAMRSRGAKIADIALLVVAAEEGLKPQTKEAIKHIKEAGIPIIAVINKIDKPSADVEKIKRDLMSQEIIVESMGGNVPSVNTSATEKRGIKELLEIILLIAEMEELKADLSAPAKGVIIESYLDSKKGPMATLLLQKGILKEGYFLKTPSAKGKVKTMEDFAGNTISSAKPSFPAIVLGFEKPPIIGERFTASEDVEKLEKEMQSFSDNLFEKFKELNKEKPKINLIIKADVWGSLEAIESILKNLPQEKVAINILSFGVGEVNDSDVKMAKTSGAIILAFRAKINSIAKKIAQRENIRIISFEVIYELKQVIRQAMERKLKPESIKKNLGKVKVLAIFRTEKDSQIIGGKVIEGEAKRGAKLEVWRNEEKAGEGLITKLKKEKEDVESIGKGRECGILYKGNVEIKEDDVLQVYVQEKEQTTL